MHLCSLLGGGKASLLGLGVTKDLALEDLHVWCDLSNSGSAWIEGKVGELGCLVGASLGRRLAGRGGLLLRSHWRLE